MDGVPIVLTDRIAASAWRLAGARVQVVSGDAAAAAFEDACAAAPLVLVAAAVALRLPEARLAAARRGAHPLVLIVPALDGPAPAGVPDVVDVVRRALGVAT